MRSLRSCLLIEFQDSFAADVTLASSVAGAAGAVVSVGAGAGLDTKAAWAGAVKSARLNRTVTKRVTVVFIVNLGFGER